MRKVPRGVRPETMEKYKKVQALIKEGVSKVAACEKADMKLAHYNTFAREQKMRSHYAHIESILI